MARNGPGTVIFDLDGTLVDTSRDLIAAGNACLAAMDMPAALEAGADARTAFQGGKALLRLGFTRAGRIWTEGEVEAAYPLYLSHYGEILDRESRAYEGAAEAVQALRAAGYRTGICTNKPSALSERLLRALGLWELFDSHVGADTLPVRKPDPAPLLAAVARAGGEAGRAMLVGDTETDRRTARNARMPVALVTFGPMGPGIAALEPEALLGGFAGLDAVVRRLIG